jgi:hypothetical protein
VFFADGLGRRNDSKSRQRFCALQRDKQGRGGGETEQRTNAGQNKPNRNKHSADLVLKIQGVHNIIYVAIINIDLIMASHGDAARLRRQ